MDRAEIRAINYSTKEAAIYIGVCKSSLDKSRVTGELMGHPAPVFVKMGKSIRYRKNDLDRWVNDLASFSTLAQANSI